MTAGASGARVKGRTLPTVIPVFPLSGVILLPGAQLPLNIFEPRYLRMVDDALAGARIIGVIQPREAVIGAGAPLYEVGGAGRITSFAETGDGRYLINLTGITRFRIAGEAKSSSSYRQAQVDYAVFAHDAAPDPTATMIDREELFEAMHEYLDTEGLSTDWEAAEDAPSDALVNSLAMGCPFAPNEKQALLEASSLADRARCLVTLMHMGGGERADDPPLQ